MARKNRFKKQISQRGIPKSANIRQRVFTFTKIEDLLAHKNIKQTIKKAVKQRLRPKPLKYQERLRRDHEIGLRKVRKDRQKLMLGLGSMQGDTGKSKTEQDPIRNMQDFTNINECNRRSDRRIALFKNEIIGKGKGSGNKRTYRPESKIKC